jgi:hypothetical protein
MYVLITQIGKNFGIRYSETATSTTTSGNNKTLTERQQNHKRDIFRKNSGVEMGESFTTRKIPLNNVEKEHFFLLSLLNKTRKWKTESDRKKGGF